MLDYTSIYMLWPLIQSKVTLEGSHITRQRYNLLFKVLLIGDVGTGKSCMRLQLI